MTAFAALPGLNIREQQIYDRLRLEYMIANEFNQSDVIPKAVKTVVGFIAVRHLVHPEVPVDLLTVGTPLFNLNKPQLERKVTLASSLLKLKRGQARPTFQELLAAVGHDEVEINI